MLEENWPSMDLVADALVRELPRQQAWPVTPRLVRPGLVPVIRRVRRGADGAGSTADRVFNRFWLYRRALLRQARRCDVFHVVDHSYAHLALALPRGRTIVTCHDTDTFRGFVTPGIVDTGLPPFLVRRLAAGLKRAAVVACPSRATATELIAAGPRRPLSGRRRAERRRRVTDACGRRRARRPAARPPSVTRSTSCTSAARSRASGSICCWSCSRIIAARYPTARLLRVGGAFTSEQEALAARLGIAGRTRVLPFLSRETLHAVYRRAALLVITSDREGFGLPVLEAMAAGLPVLARDLPVLREVAGQVRPCS